MRSTLNELRVALTFDAEHPDNAHCPPGVQDGIVDVLEQEGVRATFFMQGRWATAYPETARRIADPRLGHLVGSHSEYHSPLALLTDEGVRTDLAAAEQSIRDVTAVDPRPWFRCPFGKGRDDPRVLNTLAEAGYRNVDWDVHGGDWEEGIQAPSLEDRVVEGVASAGDGCVVLLHTWPAPTLLALRGIITRLRDAGATFVTVGEFNDTTWWYLAQKSYGAGEYDDARRELLDGLAQFSALDADRRTKSRVKEMTTLLALVSDSPIDQTRSLLAEIKRTAGRGSVRYRLKMRSFVAEVWTAVAVRLALGRSTDGVAGAAAARAILQNPLKPLSRPGLLRLLGRAMVPFLM
jgi:peptidoglycan/xylan/chitin deacetylase (PgdA/CDA1 family)